jgi:hypothetical protein
MPRKGNTYSRFAFVIFFLSSGLAFYAEEAAAPASTEEPVIPITEDIRQAMMREAAKVREELEMDARTLYERKPRGINREGPVTP